MTELWFGIVAGSLIVYVVLDGYDFGAGALHLFLARTDEDRRTILAAIGPFWDANEVWLLAFGGTLFVAFPRVLAAGLSGFYLAIFLVVWCLILRAVALEFRSHLADAMWRGFWDGVFAFASALLPVLFGVALGNVIRGVPLTADGWFQLTLFTSFHARDPVGLLDVYTVAVGVFAAVAVTAHGTTFLAWRTDGPVRERSRRLAFRLYAVTAALWPLVFLGTAAVNPGLPSVFPSRPLAWLGLAVAIAGLVTVFAAGSRKRALIAFLGSSGFLVGLLVATAACLFPILLLSRAPSVPSLTAHNSGATAYGLRTALGWWWVGTPLVVAYFAILFWIHRRRSAAPLTP